MEALKPCPFCGGESITLMTNCVECGECHACILDDFADQYDLVHMWNKRVNEGEE